MMTRMAIGMRWLTAAAMPPTPTRTSMTSPVAYAVDEIASDEKTASPIVFGIRWWLASSVEIGRPMTTRLRPLAMCRYLERSVVVVFLERIGVTGDDLVGRVHDRQPATMFAD